MASKLLLNYLLLIVEEDHPNYQPVVDQKKQNAIQ